MSTLGKRLLYYFTGFGIGIIFVIFFFQNRGCSWTPNNRVRQAIVDRIIVINDSFKSEMLERGISEEMIRNVLTKGTIDFKGSKKNGNPKVYKLHNDILKLNFTLPENSFISEVTVGYSDTKKTENSTKGEACLFLFPDDDNIIYVDSITTGSPDFIQAGSPSNKLILSALKKNGKINFEKSNFKATPKAEHYLTCIINGHPIGMKTFWYKNKINIFYLELLAPEKEE